MCQYFRTSINAIGAVVGAALILPNSALAQVARLPPLKLIGQIALRSRTLHLNIPNFSSSTIS